MYTVNSKNEDKALITNIQYVEINCPHIRML